MNDCTKYMELISAFIDGELSESESLRLLGHLEECANCSSILKAYSGISKAISEDHVPVPRSLSPSVMEKIANVDTGRIASNLKTYNTVHRVMTRYLPIAACLAFLILAAVLVPGVIGNKNDSLENSDDLSTWMSAPMFGNEEADMEIEAAPAQDVKGGGNNHPQGAGNVFPSEALPPSIDPDPADVSDEQERHDGNEGDDNPFSEPTPDESVFNEQEPGEPMPIVPMPAEDPLEEIQDENYAPADNASPPPQLPSDISEDPPTISTEIDGGHIRPYAIIEIHSRELPEILMDYVPAFAGGGGYAEYVIPRDTAEALILEIAGQTGVEIEYYDIEGGEYAFVIFVP